VIIIKRSNNNNNERKIKMRYGQKKKIGSFYFSSFEMERETARSSSWLRQHRVDGL